MRDIPLFTTDGGVASLILSQIPYTGRAFIRIQDSPCTAEFLTECVHFCRMAGAEHCYGTGNGNFDGYPEYSRILRMQANAACISDTDAALFPVTDRTWDLWREIYNQKSAAVPGSCWIAGMDAQKYLSDGDCYFVHRGGQLLGIGKASGTQIFFLASCVPGAGAAVLHALCHALTGTSVCLSVSQQNQKAMHLYQKAGFLPVACETVWYDVDTAG